MTDILNSIDEEQVQWKNEILKLIQVKGMEKSKEQEEIIYYDGVCSYCGKGKSVDKLKKQLMRKDWICDECYNKRILKRADAAYLADQSLKMLSLMYGIYPWKRFKVRLKRRLFGTHQYPWDKHDVVYKKWFTKYDRMYVKKKLPEETAEAAIVSALLERYLIIRETENEIWDFFTKSMGQEAAVQGDCNDIIKRIFGDTGRGSRQGIRNGLVIWCTIHYLCIVWDKNYAEQYEKNLSEAEKGQYVECVKRLNSPLTDDHILMEKILDKLDSQKEDMVDTEVNFDER